MAFRESDLLDERVGSPATDNPAAVYSYQAADAGGSERNLERQPDSPDNPGSIWRRALIPGAIVALILTMIVLLKIV